MSCVSTTLPVFHTNKSLHFVAVPKAGVGMNFGIYHANALIHVVSEDFCMNTEEMSNYWLQLIKEAECQPDCSTAADSTPKTVALQEIEACSAEGASPSPLPSQFIRCLDEMKWSPSLETPLRPPSRPAVVDPVTPFWIKSQAQSFSGAFMASPAPLFDADNAFDEGEDDFDDLFPVFTQNALKMLDQSSQPNPFNADSNNPFITTSKSNFSGFQTAKGEKIKVSETSLLKAEELFSEKKDEEFMGFQTASGKKFKVSDKSIEKAKLLFDDLSEGELNDVDPFLVDRKENIAPISLGFGTASGKKIAISEEHLKKAKAMFSDDADAPSNTVGFSTASGKKMIIDPKSVEKAKKIFEEENLSQQSVLMKTPTLKKKSNTADMNCIKPPFKTPSRTTPFKMPMTTPATRTGQKMFKAPSSLKKTPTETPSKKPDSKKSEIILHSLKKPETRYSLKIFFFGHFRNANAIPSNLLNFGVFSALDQSIFDEGWSFIELHKELCRKGAEKFSLEWVKNHFALIVWKFVSYMRFYPAKCDASTLSKETISNQIFYRAQREIEGHRSVLRTIIEHDQAPSVYMTLVIANIISVGQEIILHVSDGWYFAFLVLDHRLKLFVSQGKIFVGLKLKIYGATSCTDDKITCSLGSHQRIAKEDYNVALGADLVLSIAANSTRRARWDEPLGLSKYSIPLFSITSVYQDGGMIPSLDVCIKKVDEMKYLRNINGKFTILDAMEETLDEKKFQQELENRFERLRQEAYDMNEDKLKEMEDKMSEEIDELKKEHASNPFLTVSIVDYKKSRKRLCPLAILTIWRPTSDLIEMLKVDRRVLVKKFLTFRLQM